LGPSSPTNTVRAINTTNTAVKGETTSGNAIFGLATTGVGGQFNTTSGVAAIQAFSTTTKGMIISNGPSSTNTVETVMDVIRQSSGTPSNGIGGSIDMYVGTNGGASGRISNRIESIWSDATDASRTSQLMITGINSTASTNIISFEGNKRTMLYGRLEAQQGADVASVAGAIAVGLDGNVFELTGTNAVTLISNLNWQNGSEITFVFTSTATLTDGTANSGTDIGMELAGNANFVGSADDVLTLVLSEIGGVQRWREKSRTVN
jgi:hypothetical protein